MNHSITANQNFEPPHTYTGHHDASGDVDILNIFFTLWRRRIMVAGIILAGISLSLISLQVVTPLYKSHGVVLIEDASGGAISGLSSPIGNALLGSFGTSDSITSDIEILRSRSFIARILGRLKRSQSPQRGAFKSLSIYTDQFKLLPPEAINPGMIEAISAFSDKLTIRALPGSPAFKIEFTDPQPERAAYVVHTIIETYLNDRTAKVAHENKRLRDWLDERMGQLKAELREKQDILKQTQEDSGTLQQPGELIGSEELTALYEQLNKAKAEQSAIQARMSYLRNVRRGDASMDTAPEVLRSPIVNELKLDAMKLESKISELAERYGERHPRMINIRAELTDLNRSIQLEMQKTSETSKAELSLVNARIASVESRLKNVKSDVFQESDNSIAMVELQRETEVIRHAIEALLKAYAIADQQALLGESKAQVISHPAIPIHPFFPNKMLIVALGLIVSTFAAFIAVMLIEKIDSRFRSSDQIESLTGLKCIGLLPFLKVPNVAERALFPLRNPQDPLANALQDLRMEIKLKKTDDTHAPKIIAMTSSHPGEGKTTLSVWLARLSAKAGERVIVIDTDLRKPNVHKTLQHNNDLSLVDYLTDKAERSDVIHTDEPSGADFIFARQAPSTVLDLINSHKMQTLIDDLRNEYDLIILDTPAALAASDAKLISRLADMMLYIVSWRKTTPDTLLRGLKRFNQDPQSSSSETPISLILSHIDARRFVRYGYGHVIYK